MRGNLQNNSFSKIEWVSLFFIFVLSLWIYHYYQTLLTDHQPYLIWMQKKYYEGITPFYLSQGKQLYQGLSYQDTAYPPGYPIFIAILYKLGIQNAEQIRFIQGIIGIFSLFPFYFILRWLKVNFLLRIIITAFYAVFPLIMIGNSTLLAEWISPSIILWTLFLLIQYKELQHPLSRFITAFFNGLIIGIGAMFRPDLILLIVPATCWYLFFYSGISKIIGIFLLFLSFSIIVGGWGWHNKKMHDHWLFTSTSGGNTLLEGLGILPNDYGYVLSDAVIVNKLEKLNLTYHSIEGNNYCLQEYLKAWREHPRYVMQTIWMRCKNMLTSHESLVTYFSQLTNLLFRKEGVLLWGIVLILLARHRLDAIYILSLPALYALFSLGLVHYECRYGRYLSLTYLFSCAVFTEYTWQGAKTLANHKKIYLYGLYTFAILTSIIFIFYFIRELYRIVQ